MLLKKKKKFTNFSGGMCPQYFTLRSILILRPLRVALIDHLLNVGLDLGASSVQFPFIYFPSKMSHIGDSSLSQSAILLSVLLIQKASSCAFLQIE